MAMLSAQSNVQGFECRGEEPFWKLDVNGGLAKLNRPGESDQSYRGKLTSLSYLKPPAAVWRGATLGGKETLVVTFREEACRSTMADGPPMPYRAILSRSDSVATGCCNVRRSAEAKKKQ